MTMMAAIKNWSDERKARRAKEAQRKQWRREKDTKIKQNTEREIATLAQHRQEAEAGLRCSRCWGHKEILDFVPDEDGYRIPQTGFVPCPKCGGTGLG